MPRPRLARTKKTSTSQQLPPGGAERESTRAKNGPRLLPRATSMANAKVNENKNKAQKARGKQGAERQAETQGGEGNQGGPVDQQPNAHLVLAPIQVDEARQALDETRGELAAVRPAEIVRR